MTSEQRNALLGAEELRIAQKVAAKKRLTADERAFLEGRENPKTKQRPTSARSWTLLSASTEFGVSRETIRRGLVSAGISTKQSYTTREICSAIFGDLRAARAREALASAIAKERENREAEGQLIPLADNLRWQEQVLAPISQRLRALPAQMAQRCNPADPTFAQRALTEWLDDTLPMLRNEIAKQ